MVGVCTQMAGEKLRDEVGSFSRCVFQQVRGLNRVGSIEG
jgi:hypothetical protein